MSMYITPAAHRARTTDPITSKLAAADVKMEKEALKVQILKAYAKGEPMNFDDVATKLGLDRDRVWRRVSELHKHKLIRTTGKFTMGTKGKLMTEYCISFLGMQWLEANNV